MSSLPNENGPDISMAGSVKRYRLMAILAGIMSLLLWFVDLPVAYLFDNESWKANVAWIPFVHGWVYAVYVLTAIQFASKAKWPVMKMLGLILAGTLPIASLITERKVVSQYS
ncbi:integ_memb_HG, integral membrane protein [Candidatus Nanopelagicaceae bacterium]|jgi:integral membrane protein